jgi:P27 family predicted phage terminase small subunit
MPHGRGLKRRCMGHESIATRDMKTQRITIAELSKAGGISRTAIYKAIKAGNLTFPGGAADPVKLLQEWHKTHDPTRRDKIGPALERIIDKLGLKQPVEAKHKPVSAPVETAVDASGAPAHLSQEMKRFWKRVNEEYELSRDCLLILKTACEANDRAQQAREIIATEGLIVNNRRHPASDVEAQAQSLFLRAMRQLGLDVEPTGPIGRPQGR